MIKVSFCLPTYNVKKYLEKCIKSIFDQNLDRNTYEILCCEDCSTDDSLQELKRLQSIFPNIRIFQNEINRGVSFSRNVLIEKAKGDYIFFLDSDDMLYPNSIGKMLDLAYSLDADILSGQFVTFDDGTEYKFPAFYNDTEIVVEKTDMISPLSAKGHETGSAWGSLIKRSYITENNLSFNIKLCIHEDTLFKYHTHLYDGKKYKCNIVCYMYCQRDTSVMHLRTEERQKKIYLSLKELFFIYKSDYDKNQNKNKSFIRFLYLNGREGMLNALATIKDKRYVKSQLKELKQKKIYPYKLDKSALKQSGTLVKKVLLFLMPIEPFFWLLHKVYLKKYKNKMSSI